MITRRAFLKATGGIGAAVAVGAVGLRPAKAAPKVPEADHMDAPVREMHKCLCVGGDLHGTYMNVFDEMTLMFHAVPDRGREILVSWVVPSHRDLAQFGFLSYESYNRIRVEFLDGKVERYLLYEFAAMSDIPTFPGDRWRGARLVNESAAPIAGWGVSWANRIKSKG